MVEILSAKREPSVARLDCFLHVRFKIVLEIKVNDLAARRHDVAHDAIAQIEHVDDELPTERRNFLGFLALIQNQPQLFLAMRQLGRRHRLNTQEAAQDNV